MGLAAAKRKGHAQALSAFEQLWASGLDVKLVLVGNRGWMVDDLIRRLQTHPERGKRLFWLEGIGDASLEEIYARATCLLAASEGEGFGLPLIEAARYKLPILARDLPVFHEVAGDHVAYFNGGDADALAAAVCEWLTQYNAGRHPRSDGIRWVNWAESTRALLDIVLRDAWQTSWRRPSER